MNTTAFNLIKLLYNQVQNKSEQKKSLLSFIVQRQLKAAGSTEV